MERSSGRSVYEQGKKVFNKLEIFANLIKYKLSLAVAFSSATGYFLYRNTADHNLLPLVCGVFLLASGAAVMNQYTEREQDALMERTRMRPIPAKRISLRSVTLIFSFLLITGSILLLINGFKPFVLGILCVILYNLLYTSLKKITILAILPGALVGTIPPLIGFISAGGNIMEYKILLFSGFIFLWQLPHFWLLLIRYGKEYREAGFKSVSNYLSEKQIRYLIFFWALLSSGFLVVFAMGIKEPGRNIAYFLIVINLVFILLFFSLLFLKRKTSDTRGAFILLNSFGFLIMSVLMADSLLKGI